MTIKDCILCATEFLRLDDVAGDISNGTSNEEAVKLLACANNVLDEIGEYFPVYATVDGSIKNGIIAFSELGDIKDIIWIKSGGIKRKFYLTTSGIKLDCDGAYSAKVIKASNSWAMNDALDYYLLSPRVIGYGIAAEYALINGMSDEAITYDARFKDALTSARSRRERRLKERRWSI